MTNKFISFKKIELENEQTIQNWLASYYYPNIGSWPAYTRFTFYNKTTGDIVGEYINDKPVVTGLANPVTGIGTANQLAYFTGASTIGSLNTTTYPTLTELSRVKGVTSAIQTQLNGKVIYGDVLMSSNSFGGKKLYINRIDNAFFAAHKKWVVTATLHKKNYNGEDYPKLNPEYPTSGSFSYSVISPTEIKLNITSTNTISDVLLCTSTSGSGTYVTADKYSLDPTDKTKVIFTTPIANDIVAIYPAVSTPKELDSPGTPVSDTASDSLFSGYYEQGIHIPADSYLKIRITVNESASDYFHSDLGYPYGTIYLSYYSSSTPSKESFRVYNDYNAQGVGWKEYDFLSLTGTTTSGYYISSCYTNTDYGRRVMEFIVHSKEAEEGASPNTVTTRLTQIDYNLLRSNMNSSPVLHNYTRNKVYYDMIFGEGSITNTDGHNLILSPTGNITTKGVITSTVTGAPFQISSTTLVNNLNADLLDGQHGSYYQPASTAITTTNIGSQTVDKANKLTTARLFTVTDNDGTNSQSASSSFDGSGPYTIKLPSTIKATLSGNATTATTLKTARTLTIGSTGKTFDGGANVAWTLAEIGAAAVSHTHDDRYFTENEVTSLLAAKANLTGANFTGNVAASAGLDIGTAIPSKGDGSTIYYGADIKTLSRASGVSGFYVNSAKQNLFYCLTQNAEYECTSNYKGDGTNATSGRTDGLWVPSNNASSTMGTSRQLKDLFDNNFTSGAKFPINTLASKPLVITIVRTDTAPIGYTDTHHLVLNGWRYYGTQRSNPYYGKLNAYSVEVCTDKANDTWVKVFERTGVADSIDGLYIPLWSSLGGAESYVSFYGVRLTVTEATEGGVAGEFGFTEIKLMENRPTGLPSDSVGALSLAGGRLYGDIILGSKFDQSITPSTNKKNYIGTSTQQFKGIYGEYIYENNQRVYSPNNKPTLAEIGAQSTANLVTTLEPSTISDTKYPSSKLLNDIISGLIVGQVTTIDGGNI